MKKSSTTQEQDEENRGELLGKRHEYKETPEEGFALKATRLGFSFDEVQHLDRIYKTVEKEK